MWKSFLFFLVFLGSLMLLRFYSENPGDSEYVELKSEGKIQLAVLSSSFGCF